MVAITTKYHGPTNTRGARLTADAGLGRKLSVPYPLDADGVQAHAVAVRALCAKMDWRGRMLAGGVEDGSYVFVWDDSAAVEVKP